MSHKTPDRVCHLVRHFGQMASSITYWAILTDTPPLERDTTHHYILGNSNWHPPHNLPGLIYGICDGKKKLTFYFWSKHHTRKNTSIS